VAFDGEEVAEGATELDLAFCLSPVGQMRTRGVCANLPIDVTEEGTAPEDHRHMLDTNRECTISGVPVEIEGHWDVESSHNPAEENEIEIVHQP
jgi:hypothetical protein